MVSPMPLPGLRARLGAWPATRTRASTATQPSGKAEHGVQVELGDLRHVVGEAREPEHEVDEATASAGRPAAESATSRPAFPAWTRSSASSRVSGASRNCAFADQLREDTAGPEGDERPETGSWTTPASNSAPPWTIGWTSSGAPMRSAAARTSSSPARSSAMPPVSVLCAPAAAVLTTTGRPSSARRRPRRRPVGDTLRNERDPVRLEQPPHLRRGQPRSFETRAPRRRAPPPPAGRSLEARQRAGGSPQPLARSTARPSARAADSGYAKVAIGGLASRTPVLPPRTRTRREPACRRAATTPCTTASATSSASPTTGGMKSTISASIAGSARTAGSRRRSSRGRGAEHVDRVGEARLAGKHRGERVPRLLAASGKLEPAASQASAQRMPSPPAFVSTATRRPRGSGWLTGAPRRRRAPRACRARITPAWRKRASTATSEPASAAVCEPAARCPARCRAALHRQDRLLARDPARDARRTCAGSRRTPGRAGHVGRRVVLPVLEQVVRRDVRLVADRDEGGEPEAARRRPAREREAERAALRREADVPGREGVRGEGGVEADPGDEDARGSSARSGARRGRARGRAAAPAARRPPAPVSAKPAEMTQSALAAASAAARPRRARARREGRRRRGRSLGDGGDRPGSALTPATGAPWG